MCILDATLEVRASIPIGLYLSIKDLHSGGELGAARDEQQCNKRSGNGEGQGGSAARQALSLCDTCFRDRGACCSGRALGCAQAVEKRVAVGQILHSYSMANT